MVSTGKAGWARDMRLFAVAEASVCSAPSTQVMPRSFKPALVAELAEKQAYKASLLFMPLQQQCSDPWRMALM